MQIIRKASTKKRARSTTKQAICTLSLTRRKTAATNINSTKSSDFSNWAAFCRSARFFPFDFGYIPQTRGGDGDPLDVLVLMDEAAFVGCLIPSRLIGVIAAEQTEAGKTETNDRLIAVASNSRAHKDIKSLNDLNQTLVGEIEHFFVSYNEAKGKAFKPLGQFGAQKAKRIVEAGMKLFKKPKSKSQTKKK